MAIIAHFRGPAEPGRLRREPGWIVSSPGRSSLLSELYPKVYESMQQSEAA